MMNKTTAAAATLTVLTALAGAGVLVHQSGTVAQENGQGVTSPAPRTVIMAEPEPCPYPYPMAICAPEPPAPMTDEEREGLADEYAQAWEEVK